MAFVYRDTLMPAVAQWNAMSRVYGRFKKAWNDNGELYDKKLTFYQGSFQESETLKRFCVAIGIGWEEFRTQEVDNEIESMWFYLDGTYEWDGSYAGDTRVIEGTATTTQLVAPKAQEIADYFNDTFDVGDVITVTIEYGGSNKRYIDEHKLEWEINEAGIIANTGYNTEILRNTLESNPWYYLANSRNMPYTKNSNQFQLYDGGQIDVPGKTSLVPSNRMLGTAKTAVTVEGYVPPAGGQEPPKYYLGIFAMMSNGVTFSKEGDIFDEVIRTDSNVNYDGEAFTYRYSQKFIFNGCDVQSDIVQQMVDWYDKRTTLRMNYRPVYKPVGEYRENITYNTKDTSYKKALDSLLLYLDPITGVATRDISNSLFSNGQLRVYEASMMRRTDFAEMIATCLDTDYEVEEASSFEKLVAVIIVVVAVVAGFFSAGASLAAITWASAAVGLGTATMVLSVGMYFLSAFGGLSAQGLVTMIGRIAQVVGYAAMVTGFMAAVQNAGRIAAEKILKDQAVDVTTEAGKEAVKTEMLKQTFTDNLGELIKQGLSSIKDKLTEFISFEDFSLDSVTSSLNDISKGIEMYQDKEMEELESEYNQLKAEEDAYNQEVLSNQLKHPPANWLMMEDRITSYDALSEMSRMMDNKTGGDENFVTWSTNVNSV